VNGTRFRLLGAAALAAALAAPVPARGENLFYYVEDGKVVFTNTPSRQDAKTFLRDTRPRSGGGAATVPASPYDPFIEKVAAENGLDPSLIRAVAAVESGFDPRAVSPKGARGVMQFMPSTARRYGVTDLHDPYQSIRAGAEHLRDLLDEFDGDVGLALAAYNAGAGAVRRHGGVPAYRETQDYVRKVQEKMGSRKKAPRRAPPEPSPIRVERRPDGTLAFVN
jgi:soluble lytic murein transglycosylase-like protein